MTPDVLAWPPMDQSAFLAMIAAGAMAVGFVFLLFRKPKKGESSAPPVEVETPPVSEPDSVSVSETESESEPVSETETEPESVSVAEPVADLSERLGKTRQSFLGRIGKLLSASGSQPISNEEWDSLEEAMLEADVGIHTATRLLEQVRTRIKENGSDSSLREKMMEECVGILDSAGSGELSGELPKPYVINVVGVNGAGKTTTIGKLAQRYQDQGKSVLMGAADTFRAAAMDQLRVWSERVGTQFVCGREGADPGAVVFDSVSAGKARGMDIVIVDTAGRLHTKSNLMDELTKIEKVVKKVIPEAPHETWLVIDGTMGQNAIQQAREFQKALKVTGVVVTKLDGTARGGALLGIASELKLPIRYIGVGEAVGDLIPFESKKFVDAILG